MSVTIELPKEYGYVVVTTAATFFLAFWHGMRAGSSRRATGLKTPKAFADSADIAAAGDQERVKAMHLFNCRQRAHANYLELQPSTALAMLIAGVQYPLATTVMGAGWMIGRVLYAWGYERADKQNGAGRVLGFGISLPLSILLWGLAAWSGIRMLQVTA